MARGAHKVNPVGFRIGVNKNWKSRWYADKHTYADNFLADLKLRDMINEKLNMQGLLLLLSRDR